MYADGTNASPSQATVAFILYTIALLCYCGLVPLIVMTGWDVGVMYTMLTFGMVVICIDIYLLINRGDHSSLQHADNVEAATYDSPERSMKSACVTMMRDVLVLFRVVSTTLIPMLLVSLGGAGFAINAQAQKRSRDCSVKALRDLEKAGYFSFSCFDGYMPLEYQVGVPAWKTNTPPSEGRRLALKVKAGGGSTAAALRNGGAVQSENATDPGEQFGWVVPVFQSELDFEAGEAPVAWSVKAGSKVSSPSQDRFLGYQGMFAMALQAQMQDYYAMPGYGEDWGFNITHFAREDMLNAVAFARGTFPQLNLGDASVPPVFVITENFVRYFGIAYTLTFVVYTLLAIGLLDRINDFFNAAIGSWEPARPMPSRSQLPTSDPRYEQLTFTDAPERDEGKTLMEQFTAVWTSPLGMSSQRSPWKINADRTSWQGQESARSNRF